MRPPRPPAILPLLLVSLAAAAAEPGAPLVVPEAPASATAAGLVRSDPGFATFSTPAYTAILLGRHERPSLRLPVAGQELPLFAGASLIVWGPDWKRLAEDGRFDGTKIATDEVDGARRTQVTGTAQRGQLTVALTRTYRAQAVEFACRIAARAAIPDCRRAAIELGPEWSAAAGAQVQAVMADGSRRAFTIPREPTAQGAYATLLSGTIASLRVEGVHGLPGAGFTITGAVACTLEQTGSRLRWHLGAAGLPRTLQAGDELAFSFAVAPTPPAQAPERPRQAARLAADAAAAGPAIPAALFGANLARIGHGLNGPEVRHPWQKNPARDPESARYMRESGVSFFRVYLQHLFDVLGQCGGDRSQDPICPADGAPCDYTRADPFIEGIQAAGIELMPCVGLWCPPWLSSQRPSPHYSGLWMIHRAPPKDNARWAALIAGLVRHWNIEKGYGIRLWQVGNEPDDWTRYWVGGTLADFTAYFTTAAAAMKAVDPSIRISGPDLADLYAKAWPERTVAWKEGFAQACRGQFDDFSWNCYRSDDFSAQVRDARATLVATGNGQASLYLAEYNLTPGDYDDPGIFTFDGALYLCRAMRSLIANRVDRASFFLWDDDSSLGLFSRRADGSLAPRPMYHAFRLHAGLGRIKGGVLLPVVGLPEGLGATAVRHADGAGVSLLLAADRPLAGGFDLDLGVTGLAGLTLAEGWSLVPGAELQPLAVDGRSVEAGLALRLPPRAITLLVLRRR